MVLGLHSKDRKSLEGEANIMNLKETKVVPHSQPIAPQQTVCKFHLDPQCNIFHWGSTALGVSTLWCHNERDSVWNPQPHDCLLSRLFRHRRKKTSKLCVTGLCEGNSPVTGEFPAQRASNAENVPIWWRHRGIVWSSSMCLLRIFLVVEPMGPPWNGATVEVWEWIVKFFPTLYNGWNYLSISGLKLIHVSKGAPGQ